MYPHFLSSRPLVLDGANEIHLVVGAKEELEPQLSCDGQVRYTARAGDHPRSRRGGGITWHI